MQVKFIAHAGFAIEEDGFMVLIDPWFTDSTIENPILTGLAGNKTIDYQIPRNRERIEDFAPHAIVLSHFHVHHSHRADILRLIEQTNHDMTLAHQRGGLDNTVNEVLSGFPHLTLRSVKDKESFIVGPFTLTPLLHTLPDHLAWSVKSSTGHILHITDGMIHKDTTLKSLDPVWDSFEALRPDILFISAGRNSVIRDRNEKRTIVESYTFSPIQAAALAQKLRPRIIASMGNQNHSFWKNRTEFIPDVSATEEEFRWALDWLAPDIRFVPIRPGHTFGIRTKSIMTFDTVLQ